MFTPLPKLKAILFGALWLSTTLPSAADSSKTDKWVLIIHLVSTSETISTNEVTWSNITLNPDGKTIVFDVLRDLYKVSIKRFVGERNVSGLDHC